MGIDHSNPYIHSTTVQCDIVHMDGIGMPLKSGCIRILYNITTSPTSYITGG